MQVTVLDKDVKGVSDGGYTCVKRVGFGISAIPTVVIPEDKLPELVALIYRVRPQVVRDVVCKDCEHMMPYHDNEIERGHTHH